MSIILVLILFILLNTILKLSFWRWWQAAFFSAMAGIFVLAVVPYAAGQSKTELAAWLQNPVVMQNVAVLITMESVIIFAFAFMQLRRVLGTRVKKKIQLPLKFYPGLLLFPVLFYLLAQLFFALPGTDFDTVAYVLAGSIFTLLPLLSWGLSKLIPEKDLRLEIQFIVNLFVCIIGLITTVNGETAYAAVSQPLNPKALLLACAGFSALFVAGYLINKFKKRNI